MSDWIAKLETATTPDDVANALGSSGLPAAQIANIERIALAGAKARADLAASHRAREALLASVAHDLRNPLNTFAMSAGLLRDDLESPDFDRTRGTSLVTRMDRAALRMQVLVDDLIEASRIEARAVEYAKKTESVKAILAAAVERSRPLVADKGASLKEADAPEANVNVDRVRLAQALSKMVAVALKTTGEGGAIEIGASLTEDGKEARFGVFTSRPSKEEVRSGLAYLIARGIVEAQGGVLSQVEKGLVAAFPVAK